MEDDTSPGLSESAAHALLAHPRRRLIVRVLADRSSPVSVDRLAELVAGSEFDDPSSEQLRHVSISLVHTHLPRLEDDDVLAVHPADGSVERAGNFEVLHRVMNACRAAIAGSPGRC